MKAAAEELERLGIADKSGKRVRTDLPAEMREGSNAPELPAWPVGVIGSLHRRDIDDDIP